jgi:16S rRNA (cytosine967-C5)-methyltransferase
MSAFAEPAERIAAAYVRNRRFIGSKDRRVLTDRVFAILRALARLDWHWARAGDAAAPAEHPDTPIAAGEPRSRVLAALVLLEGLGPSEVAALCDGGTYAPEPLCEDEAARVAALAGQPLSHPDQPAWIRLETPAWLLPAFEEVFGNRTEPELAALTDAAPVTLRINTLRINTLRISTLDGGSDEADGGEVRAALAESNIVADAGNWLPTALRLRGRPAVNAAAAFKDGRVEVQDEGAQIAAALVGARPGMAVCDLCAGAGGKTLALAAGMADSGRLVALDRDDGRLAAATPRLRRAGVHNVERRRLVGPADPWLGDNAGAFDRVLVDAPCSGTGTWRRQPDLRWRLTRAALDARIAEQDETLRLAAGLVRPGGRLIYTTCSLLAAENEARIAALLDSHKDMSPLPVSEVWAETVGGTVPDTAAGRDTGRESPYLTLTPATHGTDGFFIAVLQRSGSSR